MNANELRGVFSALATPFDADFGLDVDALRRAVAFQVNEGIAGIVPCGSTGEFTSLSHEERRKVVEVVLSETDGRVPVIPQTGALTTAEAVELSRHAAASGAAAVLCVPPFYTPLSKDEIRGYYADITAAVDVPVIFYNVPWASNAVLTATEIAEIAGDVGIGAVKDSGGDLELMTELLQEHAGALTTFIGWDAFTFHAFQLGATASIWGAATFMPSLCVRLLQAVEAGRHEEATELWARISPLGDFLGSEGYVAGVKAASGHLGVPMGPPRRPLRPLADEAKTRLGALLEQADLAPAGTGVPRA